MSISTAIPIQKSGSSGETTPDGTHVFFHATSYSSVSHTADVIKHPLVLRAYNLVDDETITVLQVSTDRTLETAMVIKGKPLILDKLNTTLVLDIAGTYRFKLNSGLGSVSLLGHESSMPSGAYGLAHYTQ